MFLLGQRLDQAIDCVSLTLTPCKKMRKRCYRRTDRAEFIGPSTLRTGQGSIRKHPPTQIFHETFNIVTIRYNCIRIHNINSIIPGYNGLILNPPKQIRDIIVMLRVGTSYNAYGTLFYKKHVLKKSVVTMSVRINMKDMLMLLRASKQA